MRKERRSWKYSGWFIALALLCGASQGFARPSSYDGIVVFGASLSDSGNAFTLLSNPGDFGFDESCDLGTPHNVPPYDAIDDLFIPDGTYARGGHRVTNGANWVEQLARSNGLSGSVRPALRSDSPQARNYAVGGARANDYPCRFNLSDQLNAYFADFATSSPDTLFIFEIGGNDLRDVLAGEADLAAIGSAIYNIQESVLALYATGARNFLLVNVPDFGQTPAVQIIDQYYYPGAAAAANDLAVGFNYGLTSLADGLALIPDIEIDVLDLYALFEHILANPDDYGIENTVDPCIMPGVPPFACADPDTYLFWDGLHPTKAVHEIMAQEAAVTLATP